MLNKYLLNEWPPITAQLLLPSKLDSPYLTPSDSQSLNDHSEQTERQEWQLKVPDCLCLLHISRFLHGILSTHSTSNSEAWLPLAPEHLLSGPQSPCSLEAASLEDPSQSSGKLRTGDLTSLEISVLPVPRGPRTWRFQFPETGDFSSPCTQRPCWHTHSLSAPPTGSKDVNITEFLRRWHQQRNLVGFSRQRQAGAIEQELRKRAWIHLHPNKSWEQVNC